MSTVKQYLATGVMVTDRRVALVVLAQSYLVHNSGPIELPTINHVIVCKERTEPVGKKQGDVN